MRNSAYQENHPYSFLTALMTALVNGLALSVVYVPIFDVVLNALRNIEAIDVNKRWGEIFSRLCAIAQRLVALWRGHPQTLT